MVSRERVRSASRPRAPSERIGIDIATYSDAHFCFLRATAELLTYRTSSGYTTEHT